MQTFFPEYLEPGSTDKEAVALLQTMLLFAGLNSNIVADGDYGQQTSLGVRRLQEELGFSGDDLDGKFGPKTRHALLTHRGCNINAIAKNAFAKKTVL